MAARHRAGLGTEKWILPALGIFAVLGLLLAGILAVVVDTSSDQTEQVAGSSCTGPIKVVTASSFAPVFDGIATELDHGPNCVRLDVDTADGRKAVQRVADDNADVWVPDDASWVGAAGALELAQAPTAGAGTVLATSPIYMVTDQGTAAELRKAGGSWSALAGLVGTTRAKLVIDGPDDSGDGLIGVGDAAEGVWLAKDMDASALWLDQAKSRTRTVDGAQAAMPAKTGEVGLVAEHALLPALAAAKTKNLAVLPGTDYSSLMRYTWLPTADGIGNPTRAAALDRIRAKLSNPAIVGKYLKAARLRLPSGVVPPGGAASLPPLTAKPFGVLETHHIDHVFATWYPEDRRTDLLVVVDVSGSMATKATGSGSTRIDLVRQGSRSLEGLLPDDSRMGLWQFGSKLDGDQDWQQLVGLQPLDARQRDSLGSAIDGLAAQQTGTGLYDTVLAAYTSARDAYRSGVPNQVVVFTDGKNESDTNSMSASQLAAELKKTADPKRPVLLSVVTFGTAADAKVVNDAVAPVRGYVDNLTSASEVAAVFIHVAAGGLQH